MLDLFHQKLQFGDKQIIAVCDLKISDPTYCIQNMATQFYELHLSSDRRQLFQTRETHNFQKTPSVTSGFCVHVSLPSRRQPDRNF